ncbi:MAG: hypothetical protein IIA02_11445 [Proteobacteria bacterium]|uniref:N-acyl amino acid synthase FeeM domain-containing protein n=1 Tax=Aquabacterium sp. TaxID=1872578 RepID=UPI0035C71A58|nr:hypothetical protein [Pseudomonadota bacterium]
MLFMSRPTVRLGSPYTRPALETQALPFRMRVAKTREDIERVCQHRGEAYSRHQPDLVHRLGLHRPEADDLRDDVVLVMAESHEDGSILGSLRLSTNLNDPLRFEKEFDLPQRFQKRSLMEAGRMVTQNGPAGRMVVPALIKVTAAVSFRCGMDYVLLIARAPLDRMYKSWQFEDMYDGEKVITSAQPGVPVTLFFMDIPQVDHRLRVAQCPIYQFMAETHHPDIDIDEDFVIDRFNVPLSERASNCLDESTA